VGWKHADSESGLQKLSKLKEMPDEGFITEAEYETKKVEPQKEV